MRNFGFDLMRLPTTDPANAKAINVEQVDFGAAKDWHRLRTVRRYIPTAL